MAAPVPEIMDNPLYRLQLDVYCHYVTCATNLGTLGLTYLEVSSSGDSLHPCCF
jgi:hypothetical protein